jgi:hypothetical protein
MRNIERPCCRESPFIARFRASHEYDPGSKIGTWGTRLSQVVGNFTFGIV